MSNNNYQKKFDESFKKNNFLIHTNSNFNTNHDFILFLRKGVYPCEYYKAF